MKFDQVGGAWGSGMGRRTWHGVIRAPYKFQLFKVPINRGGYDSGGAYWGTGAPLYCAFADAIYDQSSNMACDGARFFLRASTREDAKRQVLQQYPNARFFR